MRTRTWATVWRQRLAQHYLLQSAQPDQLEQVVADVCGIHAQVMSSAELSLGLRLNDFTRAKTRAALWQDRTLTRTFGLRGTIHIFATRDLPLWLAALRARTPPRQPRTPLREARLPSLLAAFEGALRSGQCLTRTELAAALEQRLGAWVRTERFPAFGGSLPVWQLGLSVAAYQGILAFGPPRGAQVTYQRLPPQPAVDSQHALREVLRRYLRAYGPATPQEFARWFLTSPAAARALFAALGDELEPVEVEGWRAWQLRDSPLAPEPAGPDVHLLPAFDAYVVGCHPRARLLPEAVPDVVRKMGTAAPWPILMVDGVVSGLWTRQRTGQRLAVRVEPFVPLSAAQHTQLEARAERIGHILGLPAQLTFGSVEPRAHL